MKRKLFSLVTLLVCAVTGAWADDVTWDFTDRAALSFTSGSSYSYMATDGTTEMRYSAGSSDAIVAKDGTTAGYLKENGKTGGGTVKDIDGETNIGKTRLIRLFVTGKGKLTINCNGTNGVYKVLDGSTSGTTLIASLSANTTSDAITVSNFLWIETTTKGYITTIVWTPVSSDPCTVTFVAGTDGTCATTSLTEESAGAGVTLPAVTGITAGKKCTGWWTAADGGTKAGDAGDTYKPASDITLYAQYAALSNECVLNQVVFSNGFDAFMTDPDGTTHGTITVYDLSGTSAPTVATTTMSDGATYAVVGNELTVTSEDGTATAVYDITLTAVEPYDGDGITFNGTENWVVSPYGFCSQSDRKGYRFQRLWKSSDGTGKEWDRPKTGKTRIYFFLAKNTKAKIKSGCSTDRKIDVYVNSTKVVSETDFEKDGGTIEITGDSENNYILGVYSHQNGGDGSVVSIEITGAQTTVTSETITAAKTYTTYVPQHNLDFTSAAELTAYIATAADASTVTLTSVDKVPAGTPIVIKATTLNTPITVNVAATTDDVAENKLVMGDGATNVGGDGKYDYILSDGKFYHVSPAGPVAAGKAYLHLTAAPSARALDIVFDDVTAIEAVKTVAAQDGAFYNLAGQRVAQPSKGLYIVNGKKVIIK